MLRILLIIVSVLALLVPLTGCSDDTPPAQEYTTEAGPEEYAGNNTPTAATDEDTLTNSTHGPLQQKEPLNSNMTGAQ